MSKVTFYIFFFLFVLTESNYSQPQIADRAIKQGIWKNRMTEYVEKEILVQLKPNAGNIQINKLRMDQNLSIRLPFDRKNWGVVKINDDKNIFETIKDIEKLPFVRYAELNQVAEIAWNPNDTFFVAHEQWYLRNEASYLPYGTNDADIDASEAWDITRGSSDIIIAILDSGVPMLNDTLSHPELKDTSKIVLGRNFTNENDSLKDLIPHGTHVTGIIGASTNNNTGIAGIASDCKLLIIKIFDQDRHSEISWYKSAIEYAAEQGAKVINISGGFASYSASLENTIADHPEILIVSAAGNDQDVVRYPAAYSPDFDNVVAVSATDHNDNFAALYSNFGPEINVAAPGGYGS